MLGLQMDVEKAGWLVELRAASQAFSMDNWRVGHAVALLAAMTAS